MQTGGLSATPRRWRGVLRWTEPVFDHLDSAENQIGCPELEITKSNSKFILICPTKQVLVSNSRFWTPLLLDKFYVPIPKPRPCPNSMRVTRPRH